MSIPVYKYGRNQELPNLTAAKSQNMNLATQADERLIMNKLEIFI